MLRRAIRGVVGGLDSLARSIVRGFDRRHWTWRRAGWACVWLAGAGVLAVVAAAAEIRLAAKGRTYSTVKEIPHRRVGLVLGCSRTLPDGRRNLYFITRMNAAVELFEAGKVDYLIVSGDNHIKGYDEPTDMKLALADEGVPTNRVYCDYAGFRTLDSVVRAKEVFGQTHVTVISQQFHNERAIYIAGRRGVDAIGYNAEDVRSIHRLRTMLREQLARVKTVLDVSLLRTKPKFLGPRVKVGVTVQVHLQGGGGRCRGKYECWIDDCTETILGRMKEVGQRAHDAGRRYAIGTWFLDQRIIECVQPKNVLPKSA